MMDELRIVTVSYYDKGKKTRVDTTGRFHCWGIDYQEFESGPGMYTVAIVELDDGSVKVIHPTDVRFM